MTDESVVPVVNTAGAPLGMMDMAEVLARGGRLALGLAATCGQDGRAQALVAEVEAEVGPVEVSHIVGAMAGALLQDVVHPLLVAAERAGFPVREWLAAEAAGTAPDLPGCGHRSHVLFERLGVRVPCVVDEAVDS